MSLTYNFSFKPGIEYNDMTRHKDLANIEAKADIEVEGTTYRVTYLIYPIRTSVEEYFHIDRLPTEGATGLDIRIEKKNGQIVEVGDGSYEDPFESVGFWNVANKEIAYSEERLAFVNKLLGFFYDKLDDMWDIKGHLAGFVDSFRKQQGSDRGHSGFSSFEEMDREVERRVEEIKGTEDPLRALFPFVS